MSYVRLLSVLSLVFFFLGACKSRGGDDATATRAVSEAANTRVGAEFEPLSPSLEQFDYPHEVKRFAFKAQRQDLEMAYMDVSPRGDVEANGRAVVLFHGKNFSGAYWANTIDALTSKGYRVVVPDQIGFGKSDKPARFQYSFQALASATRALLDALSVERFALVGHSMGGMLATRYALMYPEQVERLTLVNPIGLEDWKRVVPYQTIDTWYERELQKTPEKIKAYMQANYFDGTWQPAYDDLLAIQAGWTMHPDYAEIAWTSALTYDMIFTQPVVHELEDLSMPTQLIIGVRDRTALGKGIVSKDQASKMGLYGELGDKACEAIKDCALVELEDVGHIPQYEAFKEYIKALTPFMKGDSRP